MWTAVEQSSASSASSNFLKTISRRSGLNVVSNASNLTSVQYNWRGNASLFFLQVLIDMTVMSRQVSIWEDLSSKVPRSIRGGGFIFGLKSYERRSYWREHRSRHALDDDRSHIHEESANDDAEQNPMPLDARHEVLSRLKLLGVEHLRERRVAGAARLTVLLVVELQRLRVLLAS